MSTQDNLPVMLDRIEITDPEPVQRSLTARTASAVGRVTRDIAGLIGDAAEIITDEPVLSMEIAKVYVPGVIGHAVRGAVEWTKRAVPAAWHVAKTQTPSEALGSVQGYWGEVLDKLEQNRY